MLRKKVCLLGSFAVGKTSLVQRYVKGIFSDKYLTTLGVKIDKKQVTVQENSIELIIWDLAGEDEFITLRQSYIKGSSAYFLVVDGTRPDTMETAISLHQRMQQEQPGIPFVLLLNKADLKSQWALDMEQIEQLRESGWQIFETSAKNNQGVEESFQLLANAMLNA